MFDFIDTPSLKMHEKIDLLSSSQQSALTKAMEKVTLNSATEGAKLTGISRLSLLQVRLVADPVSSHRVYCYHAMGHHSIILSWHELMNRFITYEDEQLGSIEITASTVNELVKTWDSPSGSTLPAPVIGCVVVRTSALNCYSVALTSQPTMTATGSNNNNNNNTPSSSSSSIIRQFISRQYINDSLSSFKLKNSVAASSESADNLKQLNSARSSFNSTISQLFQKTPIPKPAYTTGGQNDEASVKFLLETVEKLNSGYIENFEIAQAKINERYNLIYHFIYIYIYFVSYLLVYLHLLSAVLFVCLLFFFSHPQSTIFA